MTNQKRDESKDVMVQFETEYEGSDNTLGGEAFPVPCGVEYFDEVNDNPG